MPTTIDFTITVRHTHPVVAAQEIHKLCDAFRKEVEQHGHKVRLFHLNSVLEDGHERAQISGRFEQTDPPFFTNCVFDLTQEFVLKDLVNSDWTVTPHSGDALSIKVLYSS